MGCGESKIRNGDAENSSSGGSGSRAGDAQQRRQHPECFDAKGQPAIPPAAASFLALAMEERDPIAMYLLEQWSLVLHRREMMIGQTRYHRLSTAATPKNKLAGGGTHSRTDSTSGERTSLTSTMVQNGSSATDAPYGALEDTNRSISTTSGAPLVPHREGGTPSPARTAAGGSTGSPPPLTQPQTGEVWINTDVDEPISYGDADRCARQFVELVKMELVHRAWHGSATYSVEGTTTEGVVTVDIELKADTTGATGPTPPLYHTMEAFFHATVD